MEEVVVVVAVTNAICIYIYAFLRPFFRLLFVTAFCLLYGLRTPYLVTIIH